MNCIRDFRSFESKERATLTFIQNLQDGKVRIYSERMAAQENYSTGGELCENINNFRKQKTNHRKTYEIIVERIYFNMMDLRLDGYLDVELVYENELQKINRLQWENKKLKNQINNYIMIM